MVASGAAFPGIAANRRRAIRTPPNPLDVSTIVSIYPIAFTEIRHTTIPRSFVVEAGNLNKPSITHVGPSSWFMEKDEDQPLIEIVESSVKVAESVINDYARGLQECALGEKQPGLFFVPGNLTLENIKQEYNKLILIAKQRQERWFRALIDSADSYWVKTQNPRDISDLMRLAAKELGMMDKPWMENVLNTMLGKCSACGTLRDTSYPVCPNCKAVTDPAKATKLGIKFAQ